MLTNGLFVAANTNVGLVDADGVSLMFEEAPAHIGTKAQNESLYTYSFETRDFEVKNSEKDIAKLVVIASKGAELNAEFTFSEVKYSVKFGDNEVVSYSYNAIIADPASTPDYLFDFDGHQAVTGWTDSLNDFVSGSTKATKDVVYSPKAGEKVAHTWKDVAGTPATDHSTGIYDHQVCDCGAKRLGADATVLASDEDLVIGMLDHTHSYVASFDWTGAVNPGDKPVVVYTCSDPICGDTHTISEADVQIVEKDGSRVPATCTQAGTVTFVASATFEGVDGNSEHVYELAIIAHTLTHHDAVEASLENAGNIEYWTCSECNGYFKDAAGTISSTLEEVTIPKFTYEDPQVVSVSELTRLDGKKSNNYLLGNNDRYTYTLEKPYKSTSLQFNVLFNMIETDNSRIRFHNYFCRDNQWDTTWACWFVTNGGFAGLSMDEYTWFDIPGGYTLGMHKLVMDTRAIMCGNTFTGNYQIDVYFDDALLKTLIVAYNPNDMVGALFINSSSNNNIIYDIDYTGDVFEDAQVINVYDLTAIGKISGVDGNYFYVGDGNVYSRILKLNLCLDPTADNTELILDVAAGESGRLWLQANNLNTFFFGWSVNGHPTDRYFLPGKINFDAGINYEIEIGRVRVTEGINAGLDFIYLKVDGEYLYNDPAKLFMPSWFYADPNAADGKPIAYDAVTLRLTGFEAEDLNYVEPELDEDIDVISVNDLVFAGEYQNGSIDLLDSRIYTYHGTSEYGSVIFKGVFNFLAANYNNGDKNGTQFHFNSTWTPEAVGGCIWFNGGLGVLISAPKTAGGHAFGSNIPTGQDVDVEIGRIAIMDDGEFTGKHYFYAKANGVIVNEWIIEGTPEEVYKAKALFITGKPETDDDPGNAGNIIKNVAINKTVTITVGDHTEEVTVLQSGLVTIPSFSTDVVPSDKRIVGWTISGTEDAFNPLADHIFDNISITATIGDFKWKVTFGTEEIFVGNGLEIVVPETEPTKAYDNQNHYEFDCWVDADGNPFVEGTLASEDVVYPAKFNVITHTYGEWTTKDEPTCTVKGIKEKTCECGHKVSEEVDALGHDYTVEVPGSAVAETCTTNGKQADLKCSRCDSVQTGETILAHHTLDHVDAQVGTCTELGNVEHYNCSVCHKNFSDINGINELADVTTPIHHTIESVAAVAETCTTPGSIAHYTCSVCHKNFSDAEGTNEITDIAIAPHHTLEKVEAKSGTCTKEGNIEHYTCSVCHKNFSDAEGQNELTNVKTPVEHDLRDVKANAATCTEDGNIAYKRCGECFKLFDAEGNEINAADVVVEALGHDLVDDAEVPATYEAEGRKAGKHCSRCDYKVGGEVIPKLEKKDEPTPQRRGCKSVVAVSGVIFAIALAAVVLKRKQNLE